MGRRRERFKKLDVSCEPSAMTTSTLGTSSLAGPSTLRIPSGNHLLDSIPSSAYSGTSHPCSPGMGSHRMFLRWTTGSERARGSGTKHTITFNELYAGARWQQTFEVRCSIICSQIHWILHHPKADQPGHLPAKPTSTIQNSLHIPCLTSQTLPLFCFSLHRAWLDHGNPSPADPGEWSHLRG